MLKSSTLRPGLLVSLNTELRGGVKYQTRVIEGEHLEGEALKSRWETERTVFDAQRQEAGKVARGKARNAVERVCSWSSFGLLCPLNQQAELEAGIIEARQIANEFNSQGGTVRLGVYVITGRIADNDAEALKAINSEMRELMETMETGVGNLDAVAIRKAASRAQGLAQMLSPEAEARMKIAVDAARKAARAIVKAGESAAVEIDKATIRRIQESRLAFLDMDGGAEVQAPQAAARAVDLSPEEEPKPASEAKSGRTVDFDDDTPPSPMMAATLNQIALDF